MNPPVPKPAERSIEIRLNSEDDAKAVVQNSQYIVATMKEGKFDSIEFVVADELRSDIMRVLAGVFRVKTWWKSIQPLKGNTLYVLPHFQAPKPKRQVPVEVPVQVPTPEPFNSNGAYAQSPAIESPVAPRNLPHPPVTQPIPKARNSPTKA